MNGIMHTSEEPMIGLRCKRCRLEFAIPKSLYEGVRDDINRRIDCPNADCKCRFRPNFGKPKTEQLKEQIVELEGQLTSAKDRDEWQRKRVLGLKRQVATYRGQITLIRNRLTQGKCPYCKKGSTGDLLQHIQQEHKTKGDTP